MLNVEVWFMIREFARQGLSLSEIARRVGCDRKTVRTHLANPNLPQYTPRPPQASKLDAFKPYLAQRLAGGVFNCAVLYRELCTRGYPGKKTILRDYVQPYRQTAHEHATVRFETPPGHQGQVDWGSFGTIVHEGRLRRLWCFALTLGYSRAMYAEFPVRQDLGTLLGCHLHAFASLGGVPEQLLYDIQKTVVLEYHPDGLHRWNAQYLDFADYHGFVPRLCRPYRAQTKGKIESGVKYIRGNFWPGCPDVPDLPALNAALWRWLDEVANVRIHGTPYETPVARLAQESLRPMTERPPYDLSLVSTRKSSKDCFISYGGCRYSVPSPYALSRLTVRETPDGLLEVYAGLDCIARHHLASERHHTIVDPQHFDALWQALGEREHDERLRVAGPRVGAPSSAPTVEVRSLEVYAARLEGRDQP